MIKIRVDESDKCNGDYSLYISFKYNPYIVDVMRSQPSRFWHPDEKEWEVGFKYYNNVMEDLKDFEIDIEDEFDIIGGMHKSNQKQIIPKDYQFKIKPFNHQLAGIEYGLNHDRFFLGDEQGLGKTMQAINIAIIKKQQKNYKHCLIICGVNGLKWNWKSEVEKHSNEKAYILGTRYKKDKEYIGSVNDRLIDLCHLNDIKEYFIITNIETIRDDNIIKELKNACDNHIIDMLVLDEGHKCKDPTSIQGKNLLKLSATTMISMTGTPLMNNPLDLYIHLKWLGYEKHSYYAYKNHYCVFGGFGGYQIMGYKNLNQLQDEFGEIMLRRLKKDVLDLPEKIYTTEYVEMTPKQSKIYNEVYLETKQNIDLVKAAINPLSEMIRLRQATDYTGILSSSIQESAKLERLDELLEEIVSNGNKAIIFSNWTSMTNPTYERYKDKYNPAIITGETKDRVEQEKKFMEDPDCKIIIGTTGAMGTGLTLTAANYVIFLDEPWNRANREQAEDRAHRIGTKSNINIIFLICKNTIDEKIHELVERKGVMSDVLVDGIDLNTNDKNLLVDFLLS